MSTSSSNNVRSNLKNNDTDIQGGEKKVMKKSLSVVLTTAMALSMFSSVAFGKTSEDFTDLKDLDAATKAKFDAMISKGIFDGVSDTTFGLKDEMNRAQFAKVAALLLDLKADATTSSFSDVKADDAANGYALPYIEALKAAGVTDGYGEGTYNPAGKVTKEQLATFLVRVLGKDADAKAKTGTDTTVSDWAQGYVALALELKLLSNGADGKFGGQANATRDLLLTGAYEAQQQYVPAGKVSVTEAKATGVKTVVVTLNKPVDTAKATLSLKKGSVAVATTTKWSDDKKTATLSITDSKLMAGEYTVALAGLDADAVQTATAKFTAEDEKVTKIDFVSTSDTIAKASKVVIKLKASNQYGENASASAGNYTVYAGTNNDVFTKLTKNEAGELLLQLNTTVGTYTSGLSIIPVNLYNNDSRTTVSKNFKLGTAPFATKMEVSPVKYSTGKDALTGTGEYVTFDVVNYDQYGNPIASDATDRANTRVILNGYEPGFTINPADDANSDDITDVKISLNKSLDKDGEYTFSVYNQAGNQTVKIAVKAGKVATKLEIGEMTDVIAAGDAEAFIPLVAYDAAGNQLTVDELLSSNNYNANPTLSRIKLGAGETLVTAGEHKGQIRVTGVSTGGIIPLQPKSVVSITASVTEVNANSFATKTITVADARVPESITVVTNPKNKILANATSAFKFMVKDQYGKDFGTLQNVDANGNATATAPTATNGVASYQVAVTYTTVGTGVTAYDKVATGTFTTQNYTGASVGTNFNQEHEFRAGSTVTANAYAEIKAVIQKTVGNQTTTVTSDVSNVVTKRIEALTSTDDLTYSVNAVADLFNAVESPSVVESTYDVGTDGLAGTGDDTKLTVAMQETANISKLGREVTVTATDAAGNTVAIPKRIKSITSSNSQVVLTGIDNSGTDKKGFVLGNKTGTATVNVAFESNKGETLLQTVTVNVKNDAITSAKITAGNKNRTMAQATLTPNAFALMNTKVVDNYGKEFAGTAAQQYNYLFGVVFSVKNPQGGTVTVDQFGNLTIGSGVTSFELVATTATGLSASTFVNN